MLTLYDTSYAVRVQTGRLIRRKPDSSAAAWYSCFFFTKHFHKVKMFGEIRMVPSALLEAISTSGSGTAYVVHRTG